MTNRLLENIKPCLKQIADNSAITEKNYKVAPENISLLREAGLFKVFQPVAFGGVETSVADYAECIVEIAQSCSSSAWVGALFANHAHVIGLFSPQLQKEVWGNSPDALLSSSVAPLIEAERVDGGIQLSGKFGWSSGCNYADWAILGYKGINDLGQPGPCLAVVPKSDFKIIEDWCGEGLKGTGSHTLVLDNVFIPEHRTDSLFALNFGLSKGFGSHSELIFNAPFSPIFSLGFSAVAVGIALRFNKLFIDKTVNRTRAYNGAKVANNSKVHCRIGESANQTNAALTLLRNDWKEMDSRASSGQLPSMEDIMNWRTRQAYAVKMAGESVDRLFSAAGAGAWLATNPMQKLFRDIHIAGNHAQTDYDVASETYGRFLLELPMDNHY